MKPTKLKLYFPNQNYQNKEDSFAGTTIDIQGWVERTISIENFTKSMTIFLLTSLHNNESAFVKFKFGKQYPLFGVRFH